ncbi:glycoside hydrolase family 61 protein [Hygrophoropsis aurantiaca]|uniref:Glycoside hydrolase family 61 protein n=1 Tax=Hygrophoropsis aurantiaca TaxID=72124 RepID=A0ACB8A5D6_9AGAM|nr:glycoside hydrolase family 61 protein [Hygrophoropsis aurantiaca]
MLISRSSFLGLFALIPLVASHGFVKQVIIDGKAYQGNIPGGATNPSIIRQISTIDPVKGTDNPSLNCGMNATLASDVGNANPGSQLQINWVGSSTGDSNWPHETGPVMAYMALCDGSCATYDSANAEWFKISEQDLLPGNTTWYQDLISQGAMANVTIPSNLAPGNYLLRSEIISLQLAQTVGGVEFYPSCTQLQIGGNQDGTAPSSDEVTFPGGYTATEAGIFTPNIYNPPIEYVSPGPPVVQLGTGSGSGSSSGSSSPSSSSSGSGSSSTASTTATTSNSGPPSSSPSASTTSAGSSSSGGSATCKLKSSNSSSSTGTSSMKRRHRLSHAKRRL